MTTITIHLLFNMGWVRSEIFKLLSFNNCLKWLHLDCCLNRLLLYFKGSWLTRLNLGIECKWWASTNLLEELKANNEEYSNLIFFVWMSKCWVRLCSVELSHQNCPSTIHKLLDYAADLLHLLYMVMNSLKKLYCLCSWEEKRKIYKMALIWEEILTYWWSEIQEQLRVKS